MVDYMLNKEPGSNKSSQFSYGQKLLNWVSFIFFISILIYNWITPSIDDLEKDYCLKLYKREIDGIVIKTFINKNNKYLFTYQIKNDSDTLQFANVGCNHINGLDTFLKPGDSLFKRANSFDNTILHGGKRVFIKGDIMRTPIGQEESLKK